MSDLITLPAIAPFPAPPAVLQAEFEQARVFAKASKAPATQAAYRSDLRIFASWCAARDLEPIPATADAICAFLAAGAQAGTKPSTLARRVAAIRFATLAAGHREPATNSEAVRAVMAGIRRSLGAAPARKAPATADLITRMVAVCPDTLRGLRDRALLLIGFAGAFRRSELCALRVEDLQHVPEGIRVTIRRSKTDQAGEGQQIAIPHGLRLYPVAALRAWLDAAAISSGPIFRGVRRGIVLDAKLTDRVVSARIKHLARKAGIDAHSLSAHSLRSGYCTSAAEHNANIFRLSDQTRHKSLDVLRNYARTARLFEGHSGEGFL